MIKSPVLGWRPSPGPHEYETVNVACPRCGCIHIHGAGDGPRAAHCQHSGARDYEIAGTDKARKRYQQGGTKCRANPFRSNADLIKQIKRREGWQRVSAEALETAFGKFLLSHPAPDRVRLMGAPEFDQWLNSDEFLRFAILQTFKVRHFSSFLLLNLFLRGARLSENSPEVIHASLLKAAVHEFLRRLSK